MPSPSQPSLASVVWRGFLFLLLVVAVFVHLTASWAFSSRIVADAFMPASDREFGDPTGTSLGVREVEYPGTLGPMGAWFIDGTRSQWIIHVHGRGATLEEAIPNAETLASAGYNQLIIGYRNDAGQPADPSGMYRYGATEWEDLDAAIEWAASQGADEIAIVGYSTGAAIALSHHFKTQSSLVRSMVLDSPNVSLGASIDYAATQEEFIFGWSVPFTVTEFSKFLAGLRSSTNWAQIDYRRRLDRLSVPTLVFHGTDDLVVPIETSREMVERRPQLVELVEFEGGAHVASRDVAPARYEQLLVSFVARHWR